MSKKNIIGASSAAASFLSIPNEPETEPEKDRPGDRDPQAEKESLTTEQTTEQTAVPQAGKRTKRSAGRKKKEAAGSGEAEKSYITRTYYITKELDKALGHFSIEQGMDKSAVVRTALESYIKKHS